MSMHMAHQNGCTSREGMANFKKTSYITKISTLDPLNNRLHPNLGIPIKKQIKEHANLSECWWRLNFETSCSSIPILHLPNVRTNVIKRKLNSFKPFFFEILWISTLYHIVAYLPLYKRQTKICTPLDTTRNKKLRVQHQLDNRGCLRTPPPRTINSL